MVTRHVLIFKTVFLITSLLFILPGISVILVQNHHFYLSSLTHLFAGPTAVSSDYITSWITFRAPVAWMYTKELNHAFEMGSVGINHDVTAARSFVIASHPTTRAALLVLPIFCINVTSQGCLATRMLIARHDFAAATPLRISSWPLVAVNEVSIHIAFTSTGSGRPNDKFFAYKQNLLQASWNFQTIIVFGKSPKSVASKMVKVFPVHALKAFRRS